MNKKLTTGSELMSKRVDKSLRRRAQDRCQTSPDGSIELPVELLQGLPEAAADKLIHELRVHQIELEIQNDELRRVQHDLEISRERYFDLYNLAPVGYCTLSESGQILEANLTTATLLGITRNLLIKRSIRRFITPTQQDIFHQCSQRLFDSGLVQTCELEMVKADGSKMWVSLAASVALDREGVNTMRAVLSDITLRKHIDDELQQKNTELQRTRQIADKANLAKSEFLANMSHELRSPLNAILGFAQLLESGAPPPTPRQQSSLAQILHGGWYLLELINGVLDLASIESGKLSLLMESVSLPDVLLDCQTMMDLKAQQSGITLTFPICGKPCLVAADRTRLKQVLVNLLSNAIKYNRPNGSVSVSCSKPDPERMRISVEDNGPGLSPEKLAQLFQPFNRLGQENGAQEGTGIGLVVSKRLVELMGGEIGVQCTLGKGCVFWFELMLANASKLELGATDKSATTAVLAPRSLAQHTLLYIEDNPANMALVAQLLERRSGMHLLGAPDAMQGITLAQLHQPQLILMDINLPGINGLQALKMLHDDPSTRHIPVLAISANAMPRDIEKGLDAGFFAYLTKPIKVPEFMAAIDRGLELAAKSS
jgi:PAS domain S-box-containing protein